MRNKWMKRLFPFIALTLLLPWPVAYTFADSGEQDAVRIEIAEPSAEPAWTVFGKAIGGVTNPSDLFYIDATSNPADIKVTLYITNANELISHYRYLILNVGLYVENASGEWEKAVRWDGEPVPETVITMHNGQVSFFLPGLARYKVSIDDGVFYATSASADGSSLSPSFLLEVD